MYQVKAYDKNGMEFYCGSCYKTAKKAREVFHRKFHDIRTEIRAVVINTAGYTFCYEKPEGEIAFRHVR